VGDEQRFRDTAKLHVSLCAVFARFERRMARWRLGRCIAPGCCVSVLLPNACSRGLIDRGAAHRHLNSERSQRRLHTSDCVARKEARPLTLDLRFSTEDLGRVRFASSPVAHIMSSASPPQRDPGESSRARFRQRELFGRLSESAKPLLRFGWVDSYSFPDYLTPPPIESRNRLLDELDRLVAVPSWRVERDLEPWLSKEPQGVPAARLLDTARDLPNLASAIHKYHQDGLSDDWPDVERLLQRDIDRRQRDLAEHGLDYVLSTLHPRLRWHNPVLTLGLNSRALPTSLELGGRGLILIPSLWWQYSFNSKINPSDPLVIVYPIAGAATRQQLADNALRSMAVARLIGRSRATVLIAISQHPSCTTSALAVHCNMAISSVSEHARALREAGLIDTRRDGFAVRHEPSDLGIRLLDNR
jgi:DNA-binding transcriptional ArsR family regulator